MKTILEGNMGELQLQYKDWYDKSRKFHLLWFLFLGSIIVIGYAYGIGKVIAGQIVTELSKYNLQYLTLQIAQSSLTKGLIPLGVGATLACLSPLLGIFAHYMMQKSELSGVDQRRILITTRLKSLLITAPVLTIAGIVTSLSSAYFATKYRNLSTDLISIKDCFEPFVIVLLFVIVLSVLSFMEIKFFSKEKLAIRIGVCITAIIINTLTIMFMDFGIRHLILKLHS